MAIAASQSPGMLAATLAIALAVIVYLQLPRVGGTTLTAPLVWAVAAALAIVGVEVVIAITSFRPLTLSVLRYIAAVGTFCPMMAVLGAKRPQDRGWQWIVVSLWIVLALPALHALALPVGVRFELTGVWRVFIILLLALSWLIYAPTRFWHVAAIAVAGQTALLFPTLLSDLQIRPGVAPALGTLLCLAATTAAALIARGPRRIRGANDPAAQALAAPLERWLSFRDRWGALWALRAMARVNQTAELQSWPVRLRMSGFDGVGEAQAEISEHLVTQIHTALDSVLRRFEPLAA